jgi:hypothetical protein
MLRCACFAVRICCGVHLVSCVLCLKTACCLVCGRWADETNVFIKGLPLQFDKRSANSTPFITAALYGGCRCRLNTNTPFSLALGIVHGIVTALPPPTAHFVTLRSCVCSRCAANLQICSASLVTFCPTGYTTCFFFFCFLGHSCLFCLSCNSWGTFCWLCCVSLCVFLHTLKGVRTQCTCHNSNHITPVALCAHQLIHGKKEW